MSDSNHGRLPRNQKVKGLLPKPRRAKFAMLLSNHPIHRLCRRMLRSFE